MKQGAFFGGVAVGGLMAALLQAGAGFAENKPVSPESPIRVISTDRAPKPVAAFSQAIEANGFIFVAGITPRDPKTGQVIEGNIAVQTERVLENIKAILESAGSSLGRAVKTTVYLKDMNDFDEMGKVYVRYFPSDPPARATVEVSRLHAGRVEIELVAVR